MHKLKPIPEMTREELIMHYGVSGMQWGVRKKVSEVSKSSAKKPNYKLTANLTYLLPDGATKTEAANLLTTASGISKLIEEAVEEIEEEDKEESKNKSKTAAAKKPSAENEERRKKKIKSLKEALEGMDEERDKEQEQYKVLVANEREKIRSRRFASRSQYQTNRNKIKQLTAEAAEKKDEWDKSIKDLKEKISNLKG